jgi:hypothetical protein
MLRFRASLAFVLSAVLIATPAFAARAHHARTSGHASVSRHTSATSERSGNKSRHTSARASTGSSNHTRASRHATTASNSEPTGNLRWHRRHGSRSSVAAAPTHRLHGQQAIDPARVTEIQQALIREHYLNGDANGQWDDATKSAMLKYQADQGWQTKLTPDSRALKKLGLGPDYSNAINAKDSSFATPSPSSTVHSAQTAGFAAASGVNQ